MVVGIALSLLLLLAGCATPATDLLPDWLTGKTRPSDISLVDHWSKDWSESVHFIVLDRSTQESLASVDAAAVLHLSPQSDDSNATRFAATLELIPLSVEPLRPSPLQDGNDADPILPPSATDPSELLAQPILLPLGTFVLTEEGFESGDGLLERFQFEIGAVPQLVLPLPELELSPGSNLVAQLPLLVLTQAD
jgi:hypothetical protein